MVLAGHLDRVELEVIAQPPVSRCAEHGPALLQVALAARVPQASFIAAPAASWLDDFLAWISPEIPRCCRAFPGGDRCPPPDQPPCNASAAACADCTACFRAAGPPGGDLLVGGRPSVEQVPPHAAHVLLVHNIIS